MMETKEGIAGTGVTVIGAEAPSNYHVAPRAEASGPPQITVSPSSMALTITTPTSGGPGMPGIGEKKKRGRPRKYGPDGAASKTYSPRPISSSAPPGSTMSFSGGKKSKPRGGLSKQHSVMMRNIGEGAARTDGAHFTPHVINVNAGEDVTARVISFCQQGPRAICILSANGTISNATLRQSDSSGGTLTYEGRFEIVNLCGSFTPTEREGTRYRAGGLSVSLSSANGQVVGGCVAGLLVAAGPVQIIVGSFLPSTQPEHRPKKQKAHSNPQPFATPVVVPALPAPPMDKDENCNGQGHHHGHSHHHGNIHAGGTADGHGHHHGNVHAGGSAGIPNLSSSTSPSPFPKENTWLMNAHLHHHHNAAAAASMQEPRKSTTDINISLPASGMQ